ncbi:hypothetical protein D477_014041 [Arthrobacter crystallopoietes BAB-32]|uniref:DUF2231 domain-containing protein n=1 Tax=Arthrobacter crystallopoietes BAB-32 TaxID=1246476 RepID=N1V0M7_9MICC|nr:DUF2231 domain-containing protein [Arthrobacter crystallopoietes]EMY33599.1 hypothetical protein D477_014041 [Arthrobacter crystallopoietes BAB-32]
MEYQIDGLPLHVLLVHATVVFVPLAALCTVLSVVWPAARRRLGIVTPLLALLALVLVPLTQQAGNWLAERVEQTRLVDEHQALADQMLPWAAALFAVAAGQWLWFRFRRSRAGRRGAGQRVLAVIGVLIALAVSAGTTAMIIQVGESGSRAVWQGSFQQDP